MAPTIAWLTRESCEGELELTGHYQRINNADRNTQWVKRVKQAFPSNISRSDIQSQSCQTNVPKSTILTGPRDPEFG